MLCFLAAFIILCGASVGRRSSDRNRQRRCEENPSTRRYPRLLQWPKVTSWNTVVLYAQTHVLQSRNALSCCSLTFSTVRFWTLWVVVLFVPTIETAEVESISCLIASREAIKISASEKNDPLFEFASFVWDEWNPEARMRHWPCARSRMKDHRSSTG